MGVHRSDGSWSLAERRVRLSGAFLAAALGIILASGSWWTVNVLETAIARGDAILAQSAAETAMAPAGYGMAVYVDGSVEIISSPGTGIDPWLTYVAKKAHGWPADWRVQSDGRGTEWLLTRSISEPGGATVLARPTSVAFAMTRPLRSAGLFIAALGAALVYLIWRRRDRGFQLRMRPLIEASQDLRWRGEIRSSHRAWLNDLVERNDQYGELAKALIGTEDQIRQRLSRLNALLEASRSVGSSLVERSVLSSILEQVQEVFAVERCAVIALDERAGVFRIEASHGMSSAFVDHLRVDPQSPNSPSTRALRTGDPVQVTDTHTDLAFAEFRDRADREGYRYVLAIPLNTVHARPAALVIQKAEPYVASFSELELAAAFGRYVSLAMENAALFAQTDRKLAETRRRLEAVMGSLDDGLVLTGFDGTVYYANAAAATFAGMSLEEIVGSSEDCVLDRLDARATPQNGLRSLPPFDFPSRSHEIALDAGDGQVRDVWLSSFEVTDAHGEGIGHCHLWRDVTSDRDLHRAKEALLSTVSHELRTPLANIKAYTSALLAQDVTWDAGSQREFIEVIEHESERLNDLVTNLLDLSRIEGGMLELNTTEIDLGILLEDVVGRFPESVQARVEIRVESQDVVISGDRIRIGTVIRNLIDNAAKYAPTSSIDATVSTQYEEVVLCVRDRGPGLPPGAEEIVFGRFTRLDDRLSRETGGVGLGLAISKGIVQAHGGTITARSLPVGAEFEVRLPVCEHEPLASSLHASTS